MTTKKTTQETKPVPRKVRGTLEVQGGDTYVFTPYGQGESTQVNVVTSGKCKMYDTIGKKPTKVAHLVVPSDTPDVRAYLYRQVEQLTKDLPSNAELPVKGECLYKSDELRLYVDEEQRKIRIRMELPIKAGTMYVQKLIANVGKISQAVMLNKDIIDQIAGKEEADV